MFLLDGIIKLNGKTIKFEPEGKVCRTYAKYYIMQKPCQITFEVLNNVRENIYGYRSKYMKTAAAFSAVSEIMRGLSEAAHDTCFKKLFDENGNLYGTVLLQLSDINGEALDINFYEKGRETNKCEFTPDNDCRASLASIKTIRSLRAAYIHIPEELHKSKIHGSAVWNFIRRICSISSRNELLQIQKDAGILLSNFAHDFSRSDSETKSLLNLLDIIEDRMKSETDVSAYYKNGEIFFSYKDEQDFELFTRFSDADTLVPLFEEAGITDCSASVTITDIKEFSEFAKDFGYVPRQMRNAEAESLIYNAYKEAESLVNCGGKLEFIIGG